MCLRLRCVRDLQAAVGKYSVEIYAFFFVWFVAQKGKRYTCFHYSFLFSHFISDTCLLSRTFHLSILLFNHDYYILSLWIIREARLGIRNHKE